MKMRTFLFLSMFLSVWLMVGMVGVAEDTAALKEQKFLQQARIIHKKALTLDAHVDIPGSKYGTGDLDPGIDNPKLRVDLVKMKNGGMDGVFLAVFVGQRPQFDK